MVIERSCRRLLLFFVAVGCLALFLATSSNSLAAERESSTSPERTVTNGDDSRARKLIANWGTTIDRNIPSRTELSARDQQMVQSAFLQPFRTGNWETVISNARKLLPRRDAADVEAMSAHLQNRGRTSLPEIVTTARIQAMRAGIQNIPAPIGIEALLISERLAEMLDAKINSFRNIELMQDPLADPQDFTVYRDLIWERHVQSNEWKNATLLVEQGLSLQRSKAIRDQELKESLSKFDFENYREQLATLRNELDERALLVRMQRLNYATEILQDVAAATKDRFFAAYVVGVDSESLIDEIKKRSSTSTHETLNEPFLAEQLNEQLRAGKAAAGSLTEKARLLFAGLHWWRRGRYGAGTEAFGLLKSKPAMRDATLRLALMMPKTTPVPTDPSVYPQKPVPTYARRHLAIWAYEDRKFQQSYTTQTSTTSRSRVVSSPLTNKHFDGLIDGQFW